MLDVGTYYFPALHRFLVILRPGTGGVVIGYGDSTGQAGVRAIEMAMFVQHAPRRDVPSCFPQVVRRDA